MAPRAIVATADNLRVGLSAHTRPAKPLAVARRMLCERVEAGQRLPASILDRGGEVLYSAYRPGTRPTERLISAVIR